MSGHISLLKTEILSFVFHRKKEEVKKFNAKPRFEPAAEISMQVQDARKVALRSTRSNCSHHITLFVCVLNSVFIILTHETGS